jgi:hypothetical protein
MFTPASIDDRKHGQILIRLLEANQPRIETGPAQP